MDRVTRNGQIFGRPARNSIKGERQSEFKVMDKVAAEYLRSKNSLVLYFVVENRKWFSFNDENQKQFSFNDENQK